MSRGQESQTNTQEKAEVAEKKRSKYSQDVCLVGEVLHLHMCCEVHKLTVNYLIALPFMMHCSDTKSICEIIKGLFFFFYCPILPLWWIVEISFERCMRNRRKNRRRAAFKKKKALQRENDKKTYLLLDKFSRGLKEKKIIEFSTKTGKKKTTKNTATSE